MEEKQQEDGKKFLLALFASNLAYPFFYFKSCLDFFSFFSPLLTRAIPYLKKSKNRGTTRSQNKTGKI